MYRQESLFPWAALLVTGFTLVATIFISPEFASIV